MEGHFHGLINKKGVVICLKVRPEFSSRGNKGEDKVLQPCISSLSIVKDLADLVNRLLDLPFEQA